jgi:hypothetical protein
MDWDQVKTLLDVARMANDHPKLHGLRNAALDELEAHMTELPAGAAEEEE